MPTDENAELIETLSLAMPGENEFSSNLDGTEEGEILAFVKWATQTHCVIRKARESRDFDDDASIRFALDADNQLVEATPATKEQVAQTIADFFWQCQSGDNSSGTVTDGDRNFAGELLTKFVISPINGTVSTDDIVATDDGLAELPAGSVILDKSGIAWFTYLTRGDPRWHSTDHGALNNPSGLYGPFTVLLRANPDTTEPTQF